MSAIRFSSSVGLTDVSISVLNRKAGDPVQVILRVAADGGVAWIETDVPQVVETREQADLREHAHAGDEDEADMLGAVLDDAVEPAQVIPVGSRKIGIVEHVEDRLVVLVDQNDHVPLGVMVAGNGG